MPCYHPITAWHNPDSGVVAFSKVKNDGNEIQIACGQCIGCRLERARQWAIRIMHESQLHEENSFITLTYNDENLPKHNSLVYKHFQVFIRSLRKRTKKKIRFFMCGEYGDEKERPHYHAILFGHAFLEDRYYWKKSGQEKLYRSPTLERTWTYGDSNIGNVTFESAAYVARYSLKKKNGEMFHETYKAHVCEETGEITYRTPELIRMSLKPGIGMPWLQLYWKEVKDGKVVVRGKESTTPKYYRKYFKNSVIYENLMDNIVSNINKDDLTPERLATRERVAKANPIKRNKTETT